MEFFKPKTVNLRIQAINKYLDFIGKEKLRLSAVKIQQKTFLENVISNADYTFLKKLDKSAAEALEQIEEQQYALPYQNGKRKVHKIGVNISSASRTVDKWVAVD